MPRRLHGSTLLAGLVLTSLGSAPAASQGRALPAPSSILGFEPGAERRLPRWADVTRYFAALDRASPRVTVRTLGRTTLGRPFIAAFISDATTLANLERFRTIQRKLADPRLQAAGERERLLREGKNVVLITSSIHSTEVGGFLTPIVLADRLARAADAEARSILANAIVILVPSQNPDGVDIVGDWYRATLNTPAEGTAPPTLYHHYTGHDNNRDWYALTQVETRLTVDSLYTPWNPQIVNDVHQQGPRAGRIFVPPYMDPVEPNVDPLLTGATNALGMAMSWRLLADGLTGVATNASYDAWSPARQYSFYHRGARILTETASARLATSIELRLDQLGPGRGYDARHSSWNFPAIWRGGRWTLGDIVRYQTSASWALLVEAARDRTAWLEHYARLADRALATQQPWGEARWPSAFVIPRAQRDTLALRRLLYTLQHGQVEIRESLDPVRVSDDVVYPPRSFVVLTRQPFGTYAKSLLENQRYPDLREYPNGPPKRPYDVTAHTLPLLLGVEAMPVFGEAPRTGRPIAPVSEARFTAAGLSDRAGRRIAIYRSSAPTMDEGWTRWVFDSYRIPYASIGDREVRAGNLRQRFDVIVLPDQSPGAIGRGLAEPYPDSLRGGLGEPGAAALAAFVDQGGTLLAFNDASAYAIAVLQLPVRNVLSGVRETDFYAPGSILLVQPNPGHALGRAFTAPVPAIWFEGSPAFEITDSTRAAAALTYPTNRDPLLSGWLLGGSRLQGRSALVDVSRGRGHAILFGFRPQYRGQTMATFPLIWSAITGT